MKLLLVLLLTISTAYAVTYVPETAVKDDNHFAYSATLAQDISMAMKIPNEDGYSMRIEMADGTPAAFDIAAASNHIIFAYNKFYKESHGLVTGASVAITTTGALPTGLAGAGYFVSKIDDDFFYIMDTRAKAIAATPAQVITDQGSGIHTFTPSSFAGTVALQYSLNASDWIDIANYSTTGTNLIEDDDFNANWLRLAIQATSGQLYIKSDLNAK